MNDLFVDEFNGKKFYTLLWDDTPCWIGIELEQVFGYSNPSKAVYRCTKRVDFVLGVDYDVLYRTDIEIFKRLSGGDFLFKHSPKLIVFYEQGVLGFLAINDKKLTKVFKEWIREKKLIQNNSLTEYIDCSMENKTDISLNFKKEVNYEITTDKMNCALEHIKIIESAIEGLNISQEKRLSYIKNIYKNFGLDIF